MEQKNGNYQLVIDALEIPVALKFDGEIKFLLYDDVWVECKHSYGTIIRFCKIKNAYCVSVLLDGGRYELLEVSKIEKI